MSVTQTDLSALSRAQRSAVQAPGAAPALALPARRWKSRVLLPGAIFLAAAAVLAFTSQDLLMPATAVEVVPVIARSGGSDSGTGQSHGGAHSVQAPGWVEADPYAVGVSALTDGVVHEVLVLEGQAVEAGQVVARLVDEDARIAVDRADAEHRESQAKHASAVAARESAETTWANPVDRMQAVKLAAARFAEKQAELERWPAELAADEARADELKAELERARDLQEKGQVSAIELIRAQKQCDAAIAAAQSTRLRKPVLVAEVSAAQADADAAAENLRLRIVETQALATARAAVSEADAAVRRSEANLAEARLRLSRMEVRAPSAGVVMARLVEPGARVMLNSDMPRANQIVRLYDPRRLQVRVDIPLAEASRVGVGALAEIVVQVLPDRVFRGRVSRIVHEADIQRNTLQVKVSMDDPAPELKPEMLARAKFVAAPSHGGDGPPGAAAAGATRVFVPERWIEKTANGLARVWIVQRASKQARLRTIKLGNARFEDTLEVLDGLQPGDQVIAETPGRIRDGQRVRVTREASNEANAAVHPASHGGG